MVNVIQDPDTSKEQKINAIEHYENSVRKLPSFKKDEYQILLKGIACVIVAAVGAVLGIAVCAGIGAAIGAATGNAPGAVLGAIAGAIKGSFTGWAYGMMAASALGLIAGAGMGFRFFGNDKVDNIVHSAKTAVKDNEYELEQFCSFNK